MSLLLLVTYCQIIDYHNFNYELDGSTAVFSWDLETVLDYQTVVATGQGTEFSSVISGFEDHEVVCFKGPGVKNVTVSGYGNGVKVFSSSVELTVMGSNKPPLVRYSVENDRDLTVFVDNYTDFENVDLYLNDVIRGKLDPKLTIRLIKGVSNLRVVADNSVEIAFSVDIDYDNTLCILRKTFGNSQFETQLWAETPFSETEIQIYLLSDLGTTNILQDFIPSSRGWDDYLYPIDLTPLSRDAGMLLIRNTNDDRLIFHSLIKNSDDSFTLQDGYTLRDQKPSVYYPDYDVNFLIIGNSNTSDRIAEVLVDGRAIYAVRLSGNTSTLVRVENLLDNAGMERQHYLITVPGFFFGVGTFTEKDFTFH